MQSKTNGDLSLIKFEADHEVFAVAFSTNSKHLFSGGTGGVQVWRIQDGKQVATIRTSQGVWTLAVSTNGKYIAGGTRSEVGIWDTNTYKQIVEVPSCGSGGVDFSPNSTRVVTAGNNTAIVWDVPIGWKVFTLRHEYEVKAVKYSPKGDRIATASGTSIRVWDTDDGRLLSSIKAQVVPWYNRGLQWFENNLLILSSGKIMEFDALSGSTVSEWPVDRINHRSCVVIPQRGRVIAQSSDNGVVTFWCVSSHSQVACIQKDPALGRHLTAISSEGWLASCKKNIDIFDIKSILCSLHLTFQEPEIVIDTVILDSWKDGQLAQAESLLTDHITYTKLINHHALACRALIRTRMGEYDAAIVDAQKSVKAQRSVIGYIAKCAALVSKGDKDDGLQAIDIALGHFHLTHTTTLLLLKTVILAISGEYGKAIARLDDLIDSVCFNSSLCVVQAYVYFLKGNTHVEKNENELAIQYFEYAQNRLGENKTRPLFIVSLISGWNFDEFGIKIRQCLSEALYSVGRFKQASQTILEIIGTFSREEIQPVVEQIVDLMCRCLSLPITDQNCDQPPRATDYAPSPIGVHREFRLPRLRIGRPPTLSLLKEWAILSVSSSSWKDALNVATGFSHSRQAIYQVVCGCLEEVHIVEAVACFHQMDRELGQRIYDSKWVSSFKLRCVNQLNELGGTAIKAHRYNDALSYFTVALSLKPAFPLELFVERSKAYVGCYLWKNALDDAEQVIKLDPLSPLGYERKHAALFGSKRFGEAIDALDTVFLKVSQSSDPHIRETFYEYISPTETKEAIRAIVRRTIRDSPPVLIDTRSGSLFDESAQALSFESEPIFQELVSSLTTTIDKRRIEHEVAQYYHYAMFSHKWEINEPLYETVVDKDVYNLEKSPAHQKLEMFCKIVQELGYRWAWSDTCCIDKRNNSTLQKALTSMFKWYQDSVVTIVFLHDVPHLSSWDGLVRSIWNTRGWTLQEYHASKVVRFYTQDWTLFMNLAIDNHKESPNILSEMEKVTGVSASMLMQLQPGLDSIRDKLRLASTRQTKYIEDEAYSLLGIFSISLQVAYGEGNQALGRLLAQLLTSSGDTSILAWSGKPGKFNSCLPDSISVFREPAASHIPSAAVTSDLEMVASALRSSSVNMESITNLLDQLDDLPVPWFAGQRMKLPCLRFKLGQVLSSRNGLERVFRAQTAALGVVEIKAEEDISRLGTLYLVHPWIDFLLDRQPVGSENTTMEMIVEESSYTDDSLSILGDLPSSYGSRNTIPPRTRQSRTARLASRLGFPVTGQRFASTQDRSALRPPSTIAPTEKQTRALSLISRLKRPFGALLLTPIRRNVEEYRRVASECVITVQVEGITSVVLDNLARSVRVLDVL